MIDLNEIKTKHNISDSGIAKIIRPHYHGVDRSLVVKVNNPDTYGVRFIEDVEMILMDAFAESPQEPVRARKRRIRYTLRFDTTKRKLEGVHRAIRSNGYTITVGMNRIMDYFLAHQEILRKERR